MLKEAGAFRAPLPSKRIFEPRYGDLQLLGGVRKGDENDTVRNRGEGTFLLKQIQPSAQGSSKSAGTLTERSPPRTIRLQELSLDLEEHICEAGSQMPITDLERAIRKGFSWLNESLQAEPDYHQRLLDMIRRPFHTTWCFCCFQNSC